jgi:hypothetical protein
MNYRDHPNVREIPISDTEAIFLRAAFEAGDMEKIYLLLNPIVPKVKKEFRLLVDTNVNPERLTLYVLEFGKWPDEGMVKDSDEDDPSEAWKK